MVCFDEPLSVTGYGRNSASPEESAENLRLKLVPHLHIPKTESNEDSTPYKLVRTAGELSCLIKYRAAVLLQVEGLQAGHTAPLLLSYS